MARFSIKAEVIRTVQVVLKPQLVNESIDAVPQNINYAIKPGDIKKLCPMLLKKLVSTRGI